MGSRPAPRSVNEALAAGTCMFITGDIRAGHEFCSEPKRRAAGRTLPYCAAHAARCYLKPPKTPGGVVEGAE